MFGHRGLGSEVARARVGAMGGQAGPWQSTGGTPIRGAMCWRAGGGQVPMPSGGLGDGGPAWVDEEEAGDMGVGPEAQEATTNARVRGPTNPTDGGKSPRKHTDPTRLFLYWLGSRCAQSKTYIFIWFLFFF